MTQFVRSILGKRNPRNVPLDLYNARAEDGSKENERVQEEYRQILVEAVRGMGETIRRMQDAGLFAKVLLPAQWKKLGAMLSGVIRDVAATLFVLVVLREELWRVGRIARSYGDQKSESYTPAQIRRHYEMRAKLFEQWIKATCDFRARPEILASRIAHVGENEAQLINRVADIHQQIAAIQASAATGSIFSNLFIESQAEDLCSMVVDLLSARGFSRIAASLERFESAPVSMLRKEIRAERELAIKGEPTRGPHENPFIRDILRYA